jgi:hypothetical protein
LRDVLGRTTTYPEWAQEGVDRVISKFKGRTFNEALVAELRNELEGGGLGDLYPEALSSLAKS